MKILLLITSSFLFILTSQLNLEHLYTQLLYSIALGLLIMFISLIIKSKYRRKLCTKK